MSDTPAWIAAFQEALCVEAAENIGQLFGDTSTRSWNDRDAAAIQIISLMPDKKEAERYIMANFQPEKDTIRFQYLGSAILFVNRVLAIMRSTK